MKRYLLITAMVILSVFSKAEAHEHDHDDFPEGTLLALEGQDAISKQECALFVMDVGYSGAEQLPEQFYAKIITSYSHDGVVPAPMEVRIYPGKPGVLAGVGQNGQDQVALFLTSAELDLRDVTSFNLKWLHGNHFHTNRCINLQVHQH